MQAHGRTATQGGTDLDANVLLRARALASSEVELPGSVLHAIRRRVFVARQALQRDISAEGDNVGRATRGWLEVIICYESGRGRVDIQVFRNVADLLIKPAQ